MSIKSVLQSTFSHLYPRAAEEDDELLEQLASVPAGAPSGAPPTIPEAEPAAAPAPAAEAPAADAAPVPEPDAYDREIQHIEASLKARLANSQRLTEHLQEEANAAAQVDRSILQAAEFSHGVVHKKLGLPVHASNLYIDPALASTNGLLHAHELLREVQQARAEALCEPEDLGMTAREASVRTDPHYMTSTSNGRVRKETSRAKRAALVSSVHSVRELRQTKELGGSGTLSAASPRASRAATAARAAGGATPVDAAAQGVSAEDEAALITKLVHAEREQQKMARVSRKPSEEPLSLAQLELEEDVLRRMQAPLGFLRNPRHVRKPTMRAAEAPIVPPAMPHPGMSFLVKPRVVMFDDYEIGGCYEIPLELRNVDTLSRRLRVLPPSTPYFSISLVHYPSGEGFVAPGLHAKVFVRFAPDSLGEYEDFLLVQTETDAFGVPLRAARLAPALTLEGVIDVGWCFVGGSKQVPCPGENVGGAGKFAIVSRDAWEADEHLAESVADESACTHQDFTLAPRLLDVPARGSYDLSVTFRPTSVGEHHSELLLVCDNCHVKPLSVVGHACAVDMHLEAVDGVPPRFFSPQPHVRFPDTSVHGSSTKTISYSNRTPLPIAFRWEMHPLGREVLGATQLMPDAILVYSSADCEESVAHGDTRARMPFAIEPHSGALPAGGVAEFTVTFAPADAQLWQAYAHLVITEVPPEAMPGGATSAEGVQEAEVGLQIDGRAVTEPLRLSPPVLTEPEPLPLDVDHRFSLQVRNPNASSRTVEWRIGVCTDTALAGTLAARDGGGAGAGGAAADDGASVEIDPPTCELAPGEARTVEVVARGVRAGQCLRNIEAVPNVGEPTTTRFEVSFEGPHVLINQQVVDFGLVALGDTPSAELSFENPTETHARWWLAPSPGGSHERGNGEFSFSASTGLLEPGASTRVTVYYTGAAEHLLESALAIAVTRGRTAHVRARAMVVAHRVCIDGPEIDLGVSYVRVPASATVRLRNMTLLPTEWHFDGAADLVPGERSLSFEPHAGVLPPLGVADVRLTLLSAESGPLRALARCSVPRMPRPLAIRLTSDVQGLVVTYTVEPATGEGTPIGRELDQLVGDVHAPPPYALQTPPPLHFGRAVPCFEERHLLLVARNHSSVPTSFSVGARHHPAPVDAAPPPPPPTEGLSSSAVAAALTRGAAMRAAADGSPMVGAYSDAGYSSRAAAAAGRPILGAAHEPLRRFQSHAGARYVNDRLHAERKRALFASAAESSVIFEVTPSEGVLPPWGRVALLVTAHTQMWGQLSDELVCEVNGLDRVTLPIDIGVVGSPLSLSSNAAGYSLRTQPPTLEFPTRPAGHAPLSRRVRVRNDGALPAEVRWGVHEPPLDGRVVSAQLGVDADGADGRARVRLALGPPRLRPAGDAADAGADASAARPGAAPPFRIEPVEARIAPHSTADFRVTYAPERIGTDAARLVARARRADLPAAAGAASEHPPMALDVTGAVRAPRLELSERRKLKIEVEPHVPRSDASYRRQIVLANREDAPLQFTMAASPPFEIVSVHVSTGATTSHALAAQTGEPTAGTAPRCVLPPGESLTAVLRFVPTPATRVKFVAAVTHSSNGPTRPGTAERAPDFLAAPDFLGADGASRAASNYGGGDASTYGGGDEDDGDDEDEDDALHVDVADASGADLGTLRDHQDLHKGHMRVTFANGSTQSFPLVGVVHRPTVSTSVPTLRFAKKHVSGVQRMPLDVWNPTRARAMWKLQHIRPKRTAADALRERTVERITGKPPKQPTDDPSIFSFAQTEGSLDVHNGRVPARLQIMVTCKPKEPGLYRSRYRFVVAHGRSTEIDVEMEATLGEEDDFYHLTEQHPSDFMYTDALL